MRMIDLTRKRFGKLLVIAQTTERRNGNVAWKCLCECGNTAIVASYALIKGHTASCGCLKRPHGLSGHPLFHRWQCVLQRCENPNDEKFRLYGKRGVKVCKRWHEFKNFLADMGECPSPIHTLDRFPDKDGNYEPGNVRWATPKEQSRNRRNNVLIERDGETKSVGEWVEITGIPHSVLLRRAKQNLPTNKMFAPSHREQIVIDGVARLVSKWAAISGVKPATIRYRLNAGMNPRDAVFLPPQRYALSSLLASTTRQ